jgi:hypothetical protein
MLAAMRVEQTADSFKVMIPCDLCRREFQFGPHRYAGRKVVSWDIMICETCDNMNWDGIDPHRHPELMRRLRAEGVPLRELRGGFIAIPSRGH